MRKSFGKAGLARSNNADRAPRVAGRSTAPAAEPPVAGFPWWALPAALLAVLAVSLPTLLWSRLGGDERGAVVLLVVLAAGWGYQAIARKAGWPALGSGEGSGAWLDSDGGDGGDGGGD